MIKHYKAKTDISINVVLKNGANMHISFIALSDGQSEFYTDNKDIQDALERHHRYGKLFKCIGVVENTPTVNRVPAKEESIIENEQEQKVVKIRVNDLSEAKDYVADNFGISRTLLRSKKSIIDAAAIHNIEFEGI